MNSIRNLFLNFLGELWVFTIVFLWQKRAHRSVFPNQTKLKQLKADKMLLGTKHLRAQTLNLIKLLYRLNCFTLPFLFFVQTAASQNNVYRWVDEAGKEHFSTKPDNPAASPADLPEIEKENYSKKIKRIKDLTPRNCSSHGGIDCNAGADKDGSVICQDGFKESILPHRLKCVEARLKVESAQLSENKGIAQISLILRNYSAAKASGVKAEIAIGKYKLEKASGPTIVEPWGVAEYTIPSPKSWVPTTEGAQPKVKYRIRCKNCHKVIRKKASY